MTIARFNEIRNAFEAARTVEQINALAKSVGKEVQDAFESPSAHALAVIIRNLAKDRRDQIRRQANA